MVYCFGSVLQKQNGNFNLTPAVSTIIWQKYSALLYFQMSQLIRKYVTLHVLFIVTSTSSQLTPPKELIIIIPNNC